MSDSVEKREFLNRWELNPCVYELSEAYPDCGCESASQVDGGFGPVLGHEVLRYFVTSRSDHDLKKPKKKFSPAIFKRAFQKGMSTYRLEHCTKNEIQAAAKIVFDNQVRNWGEFGGIYGVVEFSAEAVRINEESGARIACVLDTPITPDRMSHADVVYSSSKLDPKDENSLKHILFNQIGGMSSLKEVKNMTEGDLAEFLPAVLKNPVE